MEEFIKELKQEKIYYRSTKDGIVITKRNGLLNLDHLTTLPEGVKFENHDSIWLDSLTTLPNNVKFLNGGYVDLRALTELPENTKFENNGDVWLNLLEKLPENIKFENGGDVDLNSLSNSTIKYLGKEYNIKLIDGHTMIIESKKVKGEFTIYKAKYFGGGPVSELTDIYVVQRGDYFAHGKNIKQATEDVNFKFLQNNLDVSKLVKEIKAKQTVSIGEYRLLTGACNTGVARFLKGEGIDKSELSLKTTLEVIGGHYGSDRMKELFS